MIKPLGDYVLILPDTQGDIDKPNEAGIYLPEKKDDTPVTGIIIIPAPDMGAFLINAKVWFKMWAGEKIKYAGKDYLLVHAKDIIGYEPQEGGDK